MVLLVEFNRFWFQGFIFGYMVWFGLVLFIFIFRVRFQGFNSELGFKFQERKKKRPDPSYQSSHTASPAHTAPEWTNRGRVPVEDPRGHHRR